MTLPTEAHLQDLGGFNLCVSVLICKVGQKRVLDWEPGDLTLILTQYTPKIMSFCFAFLGQPAASRTAPEFSKCLLGILDLTLGLL